MDVEYAIIKMTDEKLIRRALIPTLSMAYPKNGDEIAEMIYGTPKSNPA